MKPLDDEPLDLLIVGFRVLVVEPEADHLLGCLEQVEGDVKTGANEAVVDRFHKRNSIAC